MYKLVLLPLLVVFGAINTIELKLQNIQIVDANKGTKFFHPFMQAVCLLVGQVIVGVVWYLQWRKDNKKEKVRVEMGETNARQKRPAPEWMVLGPALLDLTATLLSYTALNMVDSSVWQISRGGNIVFTALFARCFLKQVFTKTSILGCVLALLGITGVQVVAVVHADESTSEDTLTRIIGVVLLLVSIIFNSIALIIEKWIFNKYEMSPLKMVFLQGLYGLIAMVPITIASQYITCPWNKEAACVNVNDHLYLENINQYFHQLGNSLLLSLLNIGLIISIAISVPIAVTLSKNVSPVSRALADVCRTVLIWLFGIIMTITVGKTHQQYHLESTNIVVNLLKAVGFTVLVIGTMLYHDLLCQSKVTKDSSSLLSRDDLD